MPGCFRGGEVHSSRLFVTRFMAGCMRFFGYVFGIDHNQDLGNKACILLRVPLTI